MNQESVSLRRSTLDELVQKAVPESRHRRVPNLALEPLHSCHSGGTWLYSMLRRDYYWPFFAHDLYKYVSRCTSCIQNRGGLGKHRKYINLFPAAGPLEFVALDLLGPLPETSKGYKNFLVITDPFTKLNRAIRLKGTTSSVLAQAFLNRWVFRYDASVYLFTNNGSNFESRFFESVCNMLGSKH